MAGRQDQLVIQGELTEQELAELLAQQSDGVEGGAQIVDADGNVVTVSVEQLAAAGIDIDNMSELTEDQLGSLLALANQGPPATGMHTPKAENSHHHQSQSHHQRQRNEPPQPSQALPDEPSDVDSSSDSLTMVIGEDGSLKLSDGSGQEFVLSADQLAASNIDVNNLTDDQIQQIVQMAMPNFDMGKDQEPASKRSKVSSDFNESTSLSFDQNMSGGMEGMGRRAGSLGKLGQRSGSFSLIGQEVEVKKSGKNMPATIRYCRHGAGYKVQFDDGHFEWVSEEQIELRSPTAKARSDHESYSGNGGEHEATSSRNGLGAGGVGRRVPPAIPGIKVTSQLSDKDVEPNFCCPICDQKVYQKEPAYIVIRLPACEACADSKILVLDQGDAGGPDAPAAQQQQLAVESGAETQSSPSPELQQS